ncbi:MAG: hypothetical protein V1858_04645 [Candidatus Gottesmanbacteria bacterium]
MNPGENEPPKTPNCFKKECRGKTLQELMKCMTEKADKESIEGKSALEDATNCYMTFQKKLEKDTGSPDDYRDGIPQPDITERLIESKFPKDNRRYKRKHKS